MACPTLIRDNRILWLEVPKIGSPSEWQPGVDYQIGDIVIPRLDVPIPPGKENVMFQVIGFCGESGNTNPVFPTLLNQTVIDGDVKWAARSPSDDPMQITNQEYYVIDRTVVVS